jgi:hypothetical protein
MPCPELSCRCSLLFSVYCSRACPCCCRSAPPRTGERITRRGVLRRVCLYAVPARRTSVPARVRSRWLIVGWRWRICTVLRGAWAKIKLDGLRQRPATATFPRRRRYASLPGVRMRLTRTSLLWRSSAYSTSSYVAPSDNTGRGRGRGRGTATATGTVKSEQSTRTWAVQKTMTMTKYMSSHRTETQVPARVQRDQRPASAARGLAPAASSLRRGGGVCRAEGGGYNWVDAADTLVQLSSTCLGDEGWRSQGLLCLSRKATGGAECQPSQRRPGTHFAREEPEKPHSAA